MVNQSAKANQVLQKNTH